MRRLVIAAILMPALAAAQGVPFGGAVQDTALPVEVTSETLSVARDGGSAVFEGDVVIGQGDLRLTAARVEVDYDDAAERIARMVATGGVTLVQGPDAAEADSATYDIDAGTVVLVGNVLVTQGASAVAAERAVVDLVTGEAQMEGRVRTVLGGE